MMRTIVLDFSKGKKYDRFTELIFGCLKKMFSGIQLQNYRRDKQGGMGNGEKNRAIF